jgi:actinin alpha
VEIQAKVFSRWCSKQLERVGVTVEDVRTDLSDGVKLLTLLEAVGGAPIPTPWHRSVQGAGVRFRALENARIAITHVRDVLKVRLVGIQPEHIVDCNAKMTLGLVWSIVHKCVADKAFPGAGAAAAGTSRDALLEWVREQTAGYCGVDVGDFARSWADGLAFCTLLHKFRPDELDFAPLSAGDAKGNVGCAFDGFRRIGAPVYLDVGDVAGCVPDEKSVWTQVAELQHFFTADGVLRAYENDARATLAAIEAAVERLRDPNYVRSAHGIRERLRQIPGEDRLRVIEVRARPRDLDGAIDGRRPSASRVRARARCAECRVRRI